MSVQNEEALMQAMREQEEIRRNLMEDFPPAKVHYGDDSRNPMISVGRPLYIFDVDGTLCDAEHRIHHIRTEGKKPDWEAFFQACVNDEPLYGAITTLQVLKAAGADIWLWSSRSDSVIKQTKEWMYLHRVPYHSLRMRPAADHSLDHVLKAAWYAEMDPADQKRLVAVFEDRKTVVDMWRRLGVPCFQVAPGEF